MAASTIGKPVPRIEGASKVTGGERYAADITIPGSLHARVLRSTVPHARVKRIDTSRAKALPGVHAVLTGADISSIFVGQRLKDMPLLAVDRVRFAGEGLAAVASDSVEIADEALSLIDVDLEELPAVFEPDEAMEAGAPILHDDPSRYKNAPERPAGVPNLQGYNMMENGDLEAAFAAADRVFEHTFRTQLTHHGYLEPHACTAQANADGTVEIWASNKWPYVLRNWLAEDLGLPNDRVKVHIISVGGRLRRQVQPARCAAVRDPLTADRTAGEARPHLRRRAAIRGAPSPGRDHPAHGREERTARSPRCTRGRCSAAAATAPSR